MSAGLCSPDSDGVTVDDHECACEFCIGNFCEQTCKGGLSFFDGGGPHPYADDASVKTDWKRPLVCEILIKRDDQSLPFLRPGKQFAIGPSGQGDIRGVVDGPGWALNPEPRCNGAGNVLI